MCERLVFTGKQEVILEQFTPRTPAADEVLVQLQYSLMSNGTEGICYNRNFEDGTGWAEWVTYPFYPGYCAVGFVVEAGSDVTSHKVGDRVALRGSHGTHFTARAAECVHIPDDIDFQDALWYALAKITFMGVLAADYRIGDTLLIVGAGPIGQLSTRWAAASGLEYIVVADPISSRLEMALRGGATGVIDSPIEKSVDQIRLACNGNLPGVVIDSTGNAGVFQAVLGVAADHGRVVILGDTGTPSGQHLTHDVIKRGLTIIGAHDSHNTGGWNDVTVARFFFSMIRRGRVNMGGLITHTFTAKQSATAHDFVSNHRSEVLGVIFDWTN